MRTHFPEVEALIFDLDGTLIDSKRDLVLAVNATRRWMSLPPLDEELISSYVGDGVQKLIERALGEGTEAGRVSEAMAYFLDYYRGHMLDHTVAYAGVREALDALAGRPMAVLTNKPVKFSVEILKGLALERYFRRVYGGNSFEKKKPDPMGVNRLLNEFQIGPRQAMVVGDSAIDVRTARNAGTWAAGVTYGLGKAGIGAAAPDLLLDSLAELPGRLDPAGALR
ncbi:MAG TPA: HAD-IA family hydrolase [Candidatus Acidoferrales bacterium]|nr:HAD-IA family hydrolase [Candidatus Acidoferrales bacterium]